MAWPHTGTAHTGLKLNRPSGNKSATSKFRQKWSEHALYKWTLTHTNIFFTLTLTGQNIYSANFRHNALFKATHGQTDSCFGKKTENICGLISQKGPTVDFFFHITFDIFIINYMLSLTIHKMQFYFMYESRTI